ncbi:LysM peptidoglycan-binding domain-containing protein [Gordonia sp. (in: high G+C Gram-positive bacteria)]|uniref:LysM peptidoglycan-binding domain-containing protein n=1 Tax=Gordonia sp. (in: high G+C Gram-positive bacteria) TaxID=84139 RepID=UPI002620D004|nr:LysM peptidoglycan-binding domain-containing protein [Gordonia sp. (in: high G+C Gram-positive bacteria)]
MTALLKDRDRRAAGTAASVTMTCDVPIVVGTRVRRAVQAAPTCRPTGRSPQSRTGVPRTVPAAARSNIPERRERVRIPGVASAGSNTPATTARPSSAPARRTAGSRRRWAAGVLAGLAAAIIAAVMGVAGHDYQSAATGTPAATQVVHVRSGESLSSLAERIAPELPAESVIATVRNLNGLDGTGLRPGQALVVPAYR